MQHCQVQPNNSRHVLGLFVGCMVHACRSCLVTVLDIMTDRNHGSGVGIVDCVDANAFACMLPCRTPAVQAMRRNPFAPAVPCHRVVAADLDLGGFSGSWVSKVIRVAVAAAATAAACGSMCPALERV
ncbi:hypothetical protein COO60DRAFT_1524353 [Scenedesmus sp. NREL 46B-D3]|nr:hypothetical protein COO60DRAFT_1524353 [Scenedesmus sp. NREL 46B-D3]